MLCSMCPRINLSDHRGPGNGWLCTCGEVNCSHYLRCPKCHTNRYDLEEHGRLKGGRPSETKETTRK